MKKLFALTGLLLLTACTNTQPTESFRPVSSSSASGSVAEVDAPNQGMPETTDSLEIAMNNTPVTVTSLSGGVLFGDISAPVLTLWSDYDCEYCRQFSLSQMRLLEDRYVRNGKLSVRMMLLPRSDAGTLMAKVTLCSLRQDKFHAVHGALSTQPIAVAKDLTAFAKKTGIDQKKLNACMSDPSLTTALDGVAMQAKADEIVRVPSFGIGTVSWVGLTQDDELLTIIGRELKL